MEKRITRQEGYKVLDDLLKEFRDNPSLNNETLQEFSNKYSSIEDYDNQSKVLQEKRFPFIERLIKDELIVLIENNEEVSYRITFEGLIHEGYINQINRLCAENTRLDKIENSQKANRCWMTRLTGILALGTSIAAWYYGIEIWKYYFPHTP